MNNCVHFNVLLAMITAHAALQVSHPRSKFPPNLENALRTVIDYFKLDAGPPAPDPTMEVPNLNPMKHTTHTSRSHTQHGHYPGSYRMRNQGPSTFRHTPQQSLQSHSRRGAGSHSTVSRQHGSGRPQGSYRGAIIQTIVMNY